jgi:hypothetical protein
MGAWSTDPFGNDTACDWAFRLEEYDDLSLIQETLRKVNAIGSEYLEAPDAEEAIAAADTLSRLKGRFYIRNSYTEPVDQWVAKHATNPPPELITAAIQAVDRILTAPSEALELWQESEEFDSWKNHLEDLTARLE